MKSVLKSPSAWEWMQASHLQGPCDPAFEAEFFTQLRVYNGTFKTTAARRLDDFNALLLRPLRTLDASRAEPLQALDVGISSGVTTLEWADLLRSEGIRFHLVATDLTPVSKLYRYADWFHALVDDRGHPLQYQVCGKVFRGYPSRGDVVRMKFLAIGLAQLAHVVLHKAGLGSQHVVPLVVSGLLQNPAIEVRLDDIFRDDPSYHGRFDVVRAANILNRSYFDRDKLACGLTNLARRLREGGILAVCRTGDDGSNHGSLFRQRGRQLLKFEQLGQGSDIDDLCPAAACSEATILAGQQRETKPAVNGRYCAEPVSEPTVGSKNSSIVFHR